MIKDLLQRYAVVSKNIVLLVFYVVIFIVTVIAAVAVGFQNKLMLQLDVVSIFLIVFVLTILITCLMVPMVSTGLICDISVLKLASLPLIHLSSITYPLKSQSISLIYTLTFSSYF